MWKWLHPYAKAERAYQLCNTLLPYFAVVTVVSMLVGWVWGLGFAPADYQQKDSYRIIFIHVPWGHIPLWPLLPLLRLYGNSETQNLPL